ncbi:hypothetical protein [Fangia hongkongensis]|uniref:hypothetical protein n=1 Tax=Fangia hongkongensis TaxID=270495 RepID=UPI00036D71F3|nr:hypothetical protein [Fangia hongkongensis]MBK2124616.1 hypothetical protein [Fangia hongkongensis]
MRDLNTVELQAVAGGTGVLKELYDGIIDIAEGGCNWLIDSKKHDSKAANAYAKEFHNGLSEFADGWQKLWGSGDKIPSTNGNNSSSAF